MFCKPVLAKFRARTTNHLLCVTPRVWMGYQSCSGLGFRVGYWIYDKDADVVNFTNVAGTQFNSPILNSFIGFGVVNNQCSGVGDTIRAMQSLELQTFDLEFTDR